MARPIPVFSFVFAAYAATSTAAGLSRRGSPFREAQPNDPFMSVWRARSARRGALFAKIGLLNGAKADNPRFAVQNSSDAYKDIWLGDIVETRLGFIGVPMPGQILPARLQAGQRLRFHGINVLDWRTGDGERERQFSPRECVRRHPREMLADLTEIVGG